MGTGVNVKVARAGLTVAVLILLSGCQEMALQRFIAGFFDPVVGNWQSFPDTSTTMVFVADRTFTRTQTSGVNTLVARGSYAKDNTTNTIVLTMTSLQLNGMAQTTTAAETYAIVINSEKTGMELRTGTDVFQFTRM